MLYFVSNIGNHITHFYKNQQGTYFNKVEEGAGQIPHRPIILQQLNNNREVNITGYCICIFNNILQNEILVIVITMWIFHFIATKWTAGKNLFFYSLWEKHCATKALSSATSWLFSEEHLSFFRWLKTLWCTHVIEYLLLAIWLISLFAFMQYTGAKLEKVRPEYGHEICVAVIHRWGLC